MMANDKYNKDLAVCIKLSKEWENEMAQVEEVNKNLASLTNEYKTQLPELQEVEKKTAVCTLIRAFHIHLSYWLSI
jgi:hypothetical protein